MEKEIDQAKNRVNQVIESVRIKDLKTSDRFLYNGVWRQVVRIEGGRLYYITEGARGWRTQDISANSNMIVAGKQCDPGGLVKNR